MKENIVVSELFCYPIKSCRGISLNSAYVGPMGIRYDRQWMFVDKNGDFVAQRGSTSIGTVGIKSMCKIITTITEDSLILQAPDMYDLILPLEGLDGPMIGVRVWDSFSAAINQGIVATAWATEYLSREVPGKYDLVRMPDNGNRRTLSSFSKLAFADAYPFLIISQESLDDLNSRMELPLPMDRFRPNIVLSGGGAYCEDTILDFTINEVDFFGRNLCIRCPITTTNQITGERLKEPLLTLSKYRKTKDGVIFGRNFEFEKIGEISVGDVLKF